MTDKPTAQPKAPTPEAKQVVIQVNQHIVWQKMPDEALHVGINDVFPDASDDFKASLFAYICEDDAFDAASVQRAIEKANG